MYKKILLAIDGSDMSFNALDHALKLAKSTGANIQALYVVDSPTVLFDVGLFDPQALRDAFREEGRLLSIDVEERFRIAGVDGEVKIADTQKNGLNIVETIAESVEAYGADLVVLGTHGRRGGAKSIIRQHRRSILADSNRSCIAYS